MVVELSKRLSAHGQLIAQKPNNNKPTKIQTPPLPKKKKKKKKKQNRGVTMRSSPARPNSDGRIQIPINKLQLPLAVTAVALVL